MTLTVTSPVPGAVLAANTHLVFMITAQRPGSVTARSTIVISITEGWIHRHSKFHLFIDCGLSLCVIFLNLFLDLSEDAAILGFDRITYIGSIQNNTATIGPITLSEGNTDDVNFALFGGM